jgi:hypothetical protein
MESAAKKVRNQCLRENVSRSRIIAVTSRQTVRATVDKNKGLPAVTTSPVAFSSDILLNPFAAPTIAGIHGINVPHAI